MPGFKYITIVPGMCGGKPTRRGERMRVKFIYEQLKAGLTVQAINDDYAATPQTSRRGFQISEETTEIMKFGDNFPDKL